MPQNQPTIRLPFEYVQGIPQVAAVQIRRDFEELIRNITPAPALFDAIIDSELSASNAALHQYKNLSDLVTSESWTGHLNVGVRQGPTAITETGSPSLTGKGSLSLFGLSALGASSGADSHITPWQWQTMSPPAGQTLLLQGLLINPASAQQIGASGYIIAVNCDFGVNVNGFNASGVSSQAGMCFGCTFRANVAVTGSIGVGITNTFIDCIMLPGVTVATQGSAIIDGGQCGPFVSSSSNGSRVIADMTSSSLTISNGGGTFINTGTSSTGGSVSVSDTTHSVIVGGWWDSVSFTGTPAAQVVRRFEGHCGHSVDFTGPGQVICTLGDTGLGRLQLKGNGCNADVAFIGPLSAGVSALLNAVGLTNSQVKLSAIDGGGGSSFKAYAFDAASNHNILILSGALTFAVTTASTDAGSHNRVITEDTDTLISSIVAALVSSGATRGLAGADGEDGLDGFPGPAGAKGTDGVIGRDGKDGPPGMDGEDGEPGQPGPPGNTGAPGAQGVTGNAGANAAPLGQDGEDGLDGFPGPQGATGATGATGASLIGPPGMDGLDGEDGQPGPPGPAGTGGLAFFGDGSDGDINFDGAATVLGLAPAANVYTLTRDIYAHNLTLSGTVSQIKFANFRIFVSGELDATVNCIFSNDGAAGVLSVPGASTATKTVIATAAGGGGVAGGAGTAGTARANSLGGSGGDGGKAAGTNGIGGGIAGGAATAVLAAAGGPGVHHAREAQTGAALNTGAAFTVFYGGGAGGTGGTAAAGTGTGGGGGAGGGLLILSVRRLNVSAGVTLTLRALGGNGGNATAGTSVNCGGGGGGGGGWVGLIYSTQNVQGTLTLSASGGLGGTFVGTGNTGAAGATGTTQQFQV